MGVVIQLAEFKVFGYDFKPVRVVRTVLLLPTVPDPLRFLFGHAGTFGDNRWHTTRQGYVLVPSDSGVVQVHQLSDCNARPLPVEVVP